MSVDISTLAGDPQPAPQEAPAVAPVIESKGEARPLKDIHEISVVGERTFQLEQTTEVQYRRTLVEHRHVFKDVLSSDLEPWQVKIRDNFEQYVQAASGNVEQAAAQFVADNRNVEALNKMVELDLQALEIASGAIVRPLDTLNPTVHQPTLDEVSDGERVDPRLNRLQRVVRQVAGTTPIAGMKWHLTTTEKRAHELAKQAAKSRDETNKATFYEVVMPGEMARIVKDTGLTKAQKLRIQSLGLRKGDNYDMRTTPVDPATTNGRHESMTTFIETRIKELTRSRVDFYTATGFDIAQIKFDLSNSTDVQLPHTRLEREVVDAMPAATPRTVDQDRKKIGAAIAKKIEQEALKKIQKKETEARTSDSAIETRVRARIAGLETKQSDDDIKAESERIEEQIKAQEEKKKLAVEKESLEERVKEAEVEVKKMEDEGTEVAADYQTYTEWPEGKSKAQQEVTRLESEVIKYETASAVIVRMQADLAELTKSLSNLRVAPANGKQQPVPNADSIVGAITRQITEKKAEISRKKTSFSSAGIPDIDVQFALRKAELVRAKAKLDAIQKGPSGWGDEKITRVKARQDVIQMKARLEARIKADKKFPKDTSEAIQKQIDLLMAQKDNIAGPDEYAQATKEVLEVYLETMLGADNKRTFAERLDLIKADQLPLVTARVFDNWPPAYLRAMQGLFGSEVLRDPIQLSRVTRLLTPQRFVELYNRRDGRRKLTDTTLSTLDYKKVNAQDMQYVWDAIRREAVESESLGQIDDVEKDMRALVSASEPTRVTTKPNVTDIQTGEAQHYYYRDVPDLRLRILADQAAHAIPPQSIKDYCNDVTDGTKRMQEAMLLAQEIDRLRKKKISQAYGNISSTASA